MALMALGIDAAYIFVNHRLMQAAADLAALAGARSLPSDASTASSRARSVAAANGYSSGVTVTTPYATNANLIEVVIHHQVRPFFMPVLGINTVDVGVRAVARVTTATQAGYAIFAGTVNCGSDASKFLEWSGSKVAVVGAVHSNSGVLVSGSNNAVVGTTTYHCAGKFSNTGGSNSFIPAAQRLVNQSAWPVTYTAANFTCTYSRAGAFDLSGNGAWWVGGTKSSKLLRPGVYCATGAGGTIKLSDSGITGNVTFVATSQVELSGSNFNLVAYSNNVLAYSAGTSDVALKLSGSGGSWTGLLYAPNGTAELSGSSNLSVTGGIVAGQVKLNGSDVTINSAAGSTSTPTTPQLIE